MDIVGEIRVSVQLQYDGESKTKDDLPLLVAAEEGPCLLGRDWIRALNLKIGCGSIYSVQSTCNVIMDRYPELFKEGLGKFKYPVSLEIDPNVAPKFCKARPVPYSLREKVDKALDKLQEEGCISPIPSSSWAAPIVSVLKPDESVRICGDYRLTVNRAVKLDRYPLPKPEELFSALAGGKVFSKIDLSQAYAQLCLDDNSKKYTTINTHRGLFCYNRLPYGVSSAVGLFQRVMESILKDVPGLKCFLDDILVSGKDEKEHNERLELVFQKLQDAVLD